MEKLQIIYSKSQEAIYLSHLDIVKIFEQAFSRADIPVAFSNGFNPRAEIVFAHPLSVGIESTGEILEAKLTEKVETPYLIKQLNRVLPNGITILSAEYVNDDKRSIMAKVYAATYVITLVYNKEMFKDKTKAQIENIKNEYKRKMEDYLEQKNILVLKKSKNRMERIDIKQQIITYDFSLDNSLEITVLAGSNSNLKPSTIMDGYREYIDEPTIEYNVKRTKILYK